MTSRDDPAKRPADEDMTITFRGLTFRLSFGERGHGHRILVDLKTEDGWSEIAGFKVDEAGYKFFRGFDYIVAYAYDHGKPTLID